MTDLSVTPAGASGEPVFSPPALPKGGGTVSAGGGMLSVGSADGAAGWSLPLPLPVGRELSPSLSLGYRSSAGNGAFGAGWHCSPPAICRMDRLGIPRYTSSDRWQGPDGEEILLDKGAPRQVASLPFSDVPAVHTVTAWVPRSGGRDQRLEHWRVQTRPDSPGFWLQYHADGSITLFGWSASARVAEPGTPSHVACWYAEETVSATGEHVVYRYRSEDQAGCDEDERAMHPQVANTYLVAVHAMNATSRLALLIPDQAFREDDFMTVMQLDYGERGVDVNTPPAFAAQTPWAVRQDCFSYWRWGFDKRVRRLCREVLLWHRTRMMAGQQDPRPELVSRLHLEYDASGVASVLVAAQQVAYDADGTPQSLPPVEFEPSRPGRAYPTWEALPDLEGFSAPHWQIADLLGEGLPGLLYQHAGAWLYRAPQRDGDAGGDAVTWGPAQALPGAPRPGTGVLADLDGDGQPQWLVNLPGLRGSFTLAPDGQWRDFIAADALPSELAHGAAQLVDLTGDGLQDLVMIGPRSVRLSPRVRGTGWQPAQDISAGPTLPLAGGEHRLVAFADLAGTGLQQWVEVTGEGVTYWPMLGHGRFANPVRMPGFAIEQFNASRVLFGDTDGSGTTDLLYVEPDRIRVFVSHNGNRLVEAEPLAAPEGVVLDATCKLQLVDLRGQGTAELVLSVPHVVPRSWVYRFNDRRPWLLAEVCSNTGSRTLFDYRSSAQCWLDEKLDLQRQGRKAVSRLPFPVHAVSQVTTVDDISGLRTVSGMCYRCAVWDPVEREFRGFMQAVQTDTLSDAQGTAAERSPPAQVRQWFLSGVEAPDSLPAQGFAGPRSAELDFALQATRFTRLDGDRDVPYEPQGAARRWLLRALRGARVRSETYGLDGSERADVPYSIERQRWQVRVYETARADRPAALVTAVETLALSTERIAEDPRITQSLILRQDRRGHVLQHAQVHYPRRAVLSPSPYPVSLPEGLEADARDPQQDTLWLSVWRHRVHHLENGHDHHSGLLEATRSDVLAVPAHALPPGGFSVEHLLAPGSPLEGLADATLTGYQRQQWCDAQGQLSPLPTRQALVAYREIAVLEQATLALLEASLSPQEAAQWHANGGHHLVSLVEDGKRVYVSRHELARHHGPQLFHRLATLRDNEQVGELRIDWSPHAVQVSRLVDAAGLETTVRHDWRFLTPVALTDANDNLHEVTLDALGRVAQTRFQGTDHGQPAGYRSGKVFTVPMAMEGFLALKGGEVPVATAHRVVSDSWMPRARDRQGRPLAGRMGELAQRRLLKAGHLPAIDPHDEREPPHIISLQTDRYNGDSAQQVRLNVTYSDGAGRLLQTAVLSEPGDALVRNSAGGLERDATGAALIQPAQRRWAVSGKTEFDNKGQPVRTWLPYYLDDWRHVQDDSARAGLYADTHLYDALGRVRRVLTAAGRQRRTHYYPWFTVAEDENDTA
ncbi:SpvB/TcaC N-terminal domain-containing protein [Pseudomonas plecoglossicida]|uniref:SpvB/TcaC N-terminal domain-containing protein n=1 Tax=Pseudomonas plecoglossicida TaxID=70775 RepID=UPI0005AA7252|nr:SpvB/TcaC N-terminal domain-containing protein [Pseudomonas plecoglossicida]GLR35489.1 toxin [Pseudomonas plecoglossicida]